MNGGDLSSQVGLAINVRATKMTKANGSSFGIEYNTGYCIQKEPIRSASQNSQEMSTLTLDGMDFLASWLNVFIRACISEASLIAGVKVTLCRFFSPEAFHNRFLTYRYSIEKPLESTEVIRALLGG